MWELDYKQSWAPKNWCFWTVVLEKTLESPLHCKEIQPVHPKADQFWVFIDRTDVEVETPILWLPDVKSWLIWKDLDVWKDWGQEEKGMPEEEMIGWHHQLNGHGFGRTSGVGDGQGSLVCCGSRGCKESDMTEQLNWTDVVEAILLVHMAEQIIFCWEGGKTHSSCKFPYYLPWKVKVLIAQLCPTLCNPMDYSLLGSFVHGILQARILEWVVIHFSRGSYQTEDWSQVSWIAGRVLTAWGTREVNSATNQFWCLPLPSIFPYPLCIGASLQANRCWGSQDIKKWALRKRHPWGKFQVECWLLCGERRPVY